MQGIEYIYYDQLGSAYSDQPVQTMDPKHMEWMAKQITNARDLFLPNGSHRAMYDDRESYFAGLVRFLRDVDSNLTQAAPR